MEANKAITVQVVVSTDIKKAWFFFTDPSSITRWNFASPDWCCPGAVNDLKVGGALSYRMEARDGSAGFDFSGKYTEILPLSKISFELDDGRQVSVEFRQEGKQTGVIETFETEDENSAELQRSGWQAILNNYKKYVEENP